MRTRLSGMEPGDCAEILRTEGKDALSRRLLALGFVHGTEIFCERRAPFGDTMLFWLRGFRVALRRAEGRRVIVEMGERDEKYRAGGQSELREIRAVQPSDRRRRGGGQLAGRYGGAQGGL